MQALVGVASGAAAGLVGLPAEAANIAEAARLDGAACSLPIDGAPLSVGPLLGCMSRFDAALAFEAELPACHGVQGIDIAFIAVLALVVIAVVRFRHATARRKLDLARKMVEQGMEPPEDLLGSKAGNDLRRGLVLVFAGIGLLVASFVGGGEELSPAGLIPGFIGLGYLVSHRFAVRRNRGGPR